MEGAYPDDIIITTLALTDVPKATWPHLKTIVSDIERRRVECFRLERNIYEFIAAHALKRLTISEATGRDPSALEFDIRPGGKPVVAGGRGPHFSISHCDGLVACAISSNIPIGVDVEPLSRNVSLNTMQSNLTPDERDWLFDLEENTRVRGFISLWTLKEALVKSNGNGFSQGFQSFSILFDPIRVIFSDRTNIDPRPWNFRQRTIAGNYQLSIAWQGCDARVLYRNKVF